MGHLQIYACLILIVWNAHQYQVIKYYYYYYYYRRRRHDDLKMFPEIF